ncbi:DUF3560 domain-containing protein [Planotetraspora sp. GP83]|uniref:DUF3560 domain-containing protein n=1 Tax=Planotetraspora sp. GP83 TaxID=3156264 RepID=UPI003513AA4E
MTSTTPAADAPAPRGTLRIVHDRTEGTRLLGSRKGDGAWEAVRNITGWRWSRNVGIYVRNSRDRAADRWVIDRAVQALQAAGFTVAVEVDDVTSGRSFADAEGERNDLAEARADRFAARAERNTAAGNARWERARDRLSQIPPGQPILVGHHSERGHRRLLEQTHRQEGRAIEELGKGRYWAGRAAAAGRYQEHREDVGTTRRRLDRLEKDRRDLAELLADGFEHTYWGDERPPDGAVVLSKGETYTHCRVWLTGDDKTRRETDLAQLDDEIAYWKGVLADAEQRGVKLWTKADFDKGDFVIYMGHAIEVTRANPKSVTIPWSHYWAGSGLPVVTVEWARQRDRFDGRMSTSTVAYDKVEGRLSKQEGVAALSMTAAEAKQLIAAKIREARGLTGE